MKLSELIEAGAVVQSGYQKVTTKWTNEDTGKEYEFDVEVKREMSAADHDFILIGYAQADGEDKSYMVRRVHRMVRLDGQAIPLATAESFKVTLLMALCAAIDAKEVKPVEKKK